MATFSGGANDEVITPGFLSPSVFANPLGARPSDDDDTLDGGAGADVMDGGGGNDDYIVDSVGDLVIEAGAGLSGGDDRVISFVSFTLSDNIERLVLATAGGVLGRGNALANTINGSNSNNRLEGLDGNDTLLGGLGNDRIFGGAGRDSLLGGVGNDELDGGADADVLNGGDGNDTLIGGSGEDRILAGAGADIIVFGRGQEIDHVSGGVGIDTLDASRVQEALVVDLRAGTLISRPSGERTTISGVEIVIGGRASDSITMAGSGRASGGKVTTSSPATTAGSAQPTAATE